MTTPDDYAVQRDAWTTAIRLAKSLDGEPAPYQFTEATLPLVLDALVKLLDAALRINGAFAVNLSDDQLEDCQRRAAGQQDAIDDYVRGWLDSQMARVMLDDVGGSET